MRYAIKVPLVPSMIILILSVLAGLLPIRSGDIIELSLFSAFILFICVMSNAVWSRYLYKYAGGTESLYTFAAFYLPPFVFAIDRFMSRFPEWSPGSSSVYSVISGIFIFVGMILYVAATWLTAKSIDKGSANSQILPVSTIRIFFWILFLPVGIWVIRDRVLEAGNIVRKVDVF